MSKIILVSNRLSTSVSVDDDGIHFSPSMGGLATGLGSLHAEESSLWVGWSGVQADQVPPDQMATIDRRLRREYKSLQVPLSSEELNLFYYGFCNDTVWPLFHYFPTFAEYSNQMWESYRQVNEKYFEKIMEVADEDDYIWIHDYHLMLLPRLLKKALPHSRIGFFLHIPFPSYELFLLLPWREAILEGLLGADLVGFHTFDYARHFLSSVRRLLGAEHNMGVVKFDNRMIRVDAFPMGIDYDKYSGASEKPEVQQAMENVRRQLNGRRLVLSVDRLDYSKGIPIRLRAYYRFLEDHPEYHEKVQLVLVVAPSRTQVQQYANLKREIDELVSTINGTFGTIGWIPISYFFRPFGFDQLTALYAQADVLLVTPLRDGMNLISKEYIAARKDKKGVVILSETAGSARELGETLSVNPNNMDGIADRIREALEMPESEQQERNRRMHQRLHRYDIHYWAQDFMDKLRAVGEMQASFLMKRLSNPIKQDMFKRFQESESRLLFIDFDGTLISYGESPGIPDQDTLESLRVLANNPRTDVVIISGRQKQELQHTLDDIPVGVVAGHGIWIREEAGDWQETESVSGDWKEAILPILELYRDRTPGSQITENEYSLLWHYRNAQPELAALRLSELKDALFSLTANLDLSIFEGNKVLEIKNSRVSKGRAASHWVEKQNWEFVMAIGDDWTDEDVFRLLPEHAYSIKVGVDMSSANYFLKSVDQVRNLLHEMRAIAATV
jgi:trehalose 6-phosphate synthase/phosphatase